MDVEDLEGIENVHIDEFDQYLGGDDMDIDIPEEEFLSNTEQDHFGMFKLALDKLHLEDCNVCLERGFNMKLHEGRVSDVMRTVLTLYGSSAQRTLCIQLLLV
ncbi:uncharacterized protein BXZ73DRAFT_104175 [Epithele typhae]|uniref:uncharacterized protein n=1 Tax=Epithele typhae TaxID=378194 RepID=UPI002008B229|nr:uncharacterized protein BXZ73DRAFT_104175 [Epithele typhae]KAH9922352.1 hypothetical protein BXZ73DRAFT_104175 [Epithele typhae]